MKKVCVIGDGGWGTALALVLHQNGHSVSIWGPFKDYIEKVKESNENSMFLPDIQLPPELTWTHDQHTVVQDAELAIIAVPTKYYTDVLQSFAGLLPDSCLVVSVAKGFDPDTNERMTQVAERILGITSVAALSGPSHAEEVAREIPTAVTVACHDQTRAQKLQTLLSNPKFRVYTSDDVAGIELGGALKNIIAIAVGISDGLGFGDNTRAALITRGLAEISRLGCALGARPETFNGLSGMGDLIVTCTSRLSRNRSTGEKIGKGETIDSIMGGTKQAVEGVWNCATARTIAQKLNVEMPITEEIYAVIHEGKSPLDAVTSLLQRDVKPEIQPVI